MPAVMFAPSELVIDCELKHPHHLVVCQPHAIQIIQLVEGPPPPARPISSVIESSSAGSSCPSDSESDEDCSSYCSSIITPDDADPERAPIPWTDDTYSVRMKRVHAWRDGFVNATWDLSETTRIPLKRKTHPHPAEDDAVSQTSKRSRLSRLSGHPCPACDAHFPSRSSLQKHGLDPEVPEACRVAVEYNFE